MRFASAQTAVALVVLLAASSRPGTTLGQTIKATEMWLEIPELKGRVEANSFAVLDALPSSGISQMRVHIDKQPIDASYGDIHTKINTEATDDITAKRGVAEGVLCELDLTHWGSGFKLKPGRNSVEAYYVDRYKRVHYASFLLEFAEQRSTKARKPGSGAPERIGGEKYAVIVGISKYKNGGTGLANLKYASRDALAFRDFLESPAGGSFPEENVQTLFDEKATSQNLRSALFTFLTKPRPQDMVVIYFAGHGAPDPNDSRNLYLLTYDTQPDDMGGTAFLMSDLQDVFDRIVKAKHVITLIDSCHSYGISGERFGAKQNNLSNQYLERYASKADRAVITASDVSELSLEGEQWGGGHGVFTYFVLKGLQNNEADTNKDGTVTAGELFSYLSERVPQATNHQQNPRAVPGLAQNLPLSGAGVQKLSAKLGAGQ
jgi:caspase domain-containing protein